MSRTDIKKPIILIAICLYIGGVVDYFTIFNWLTTGLVLLVILLVNGLIISIEDRQKDGFDYDETESKESKDSFRKACLVHIFFIFLIASCAVISVLIG